jgi:thermostable 8-oxoguanine DNA glycosylase
MKDVKREEVPRLSDDDIKRLTLNLVRNKPIFKKVLNRAYEQWDTLKDYIISGSRKEIVKMKIGLSFKGASLLLRKIGFNVAVLDVLVLKKVFGIPTKEIRRIQTSWKSYKHYEDRLMEMYPNQVEWDEQFWKENAIMGKEVIALDNLYMGDPYDET